MMKNLAMCPEVGWASKVRDVWIQLMLSQHPTTALQSFIAVDTPQTIDWDIDQELAGCLMRDTADCLPHAALSMSAQSVVDLCGALQCFNGGETSVKLASAGRSKDTGEDGLDTAMAKLVSQGT